MKRVEVFWWGYGGGSWMAEKLRYMIEDQLEMKLVTIHEHPDANIPWKLDTVYENLKKADIIILPANYKRQPCKSNNRLTQAMALRKPVICEPMPSYIPVVKNYENAIMLAEGSDQEWYYALKILRDNEFLRNKLAAKAYETSKKFSQEEMSLKWINLLISLDSKGKTDIDVVIPTKNNIAILDECLKSFENSTLTETVYIVDNGEGVEDLVKKYNIPFEVKEI